MPRGLGYSGAPVEYLIKQYSLQQGALEIEYIEEFFLDFPRKKTAAEVIQRLGERDHQILMAEATLPDEPGTLVPVSFKVAHELRAHESDPKLADLVVQLEDCVTFEDRRVLYQWIGGTRKDWRGQGHFRALTEEQEAWALANGFDEIVVKTKNRFYEMRSTLAQLNFDVIRFVPHPFDHGESKVFLSKRLGQHVIDAHRSRRSVVRDE
jgi:GNAT superfamily N-acetyltransferase